MACMPSASKIHFGRALTLLLLFAASPCVLAQEYKIATADESALTLVRVNLIVEKHGNKHTVEINGKVVANYSPTIIEDFPSTGIVIDDLNHIMTFLGYRWVEGWEKGSIYIRRRE
jgi:hypothetical protein